MSNWRNRGAARGFRIPGDDDDDERSNEDSNEDSSEHDNEQPIWLKDAKIVNMGGHYAFRPYDGEDGMSLMMYLSNVKGFDTEVYAMNMLQRTSETELTGRAMHVLLDALYKSLPSGVRSVIDVHLCDVDLSARGQIQYEDSLGVRVNIWRHEAFLVPRGNSYQSPPLRSNGREYSIVVANINSRRDEPDYVTMLMRWGPRADIPEDEPDDRKKSTITHWGLVDSSPADVKLKDQEGTKARIEKLFAKEGIREAEQFPIWTPSTAPGADWQSGFIAYDAVAQLLERIGTMTLRHQPFSVDTTFAGLRPWFSPDTLRAEALGHAAMKAMQRLMYKARIGLFPIDYLNDGLAEDVRPEALRPRTGTKPFAYEIFGFGGQPLPPPPGPPAGPGVVAPGAGAAGAAGDGGEVAGEPRAAALGSAGGSPGVVNPAIEAPALESSDSEGEGEEPRDPEAFPRWDQDTYSASEAETMHRYLVTKWEDRRAIKETLDEAEEALHNTQVFSDRVVHEVLEAPHNNVPSAYAAERLLVHQVMALTRHAEQQNTFLNRQGVGDQMHAHMRELLRLDEVMAEFQHRIDLLRQRHSAAESHLNRAYAARRGLPMSDLADLGVEAVGSMIADHGSQNTQLSIDGDAPNTADAARRNSRKRKYNFEKTSEVDDWGNEVYTIKAARPQRAARRQRR
ncbi:hypothetical protein F4808DRAFT_438876 [Astrocystis sublimbata]|nr:hypothetical protein F4808DRAFT_438876 [Astrocystis sublimbata]